MAEGGGSYDGGNDEPGGGDGKFGYEGGVADSDGGVEDDGGVDIYDDNDANASDDLRKTDGEDDAGVGGGNSNDHGDVAGNGIFGKMCIGG